MGYCGICNTHNVTFRNGICENCGADSNDELEIAQRILRAVKHAKADGWKIYPNIPAWGDPIDDVLAEYEDRVKSLQTS